MKARFRTRQIFGKYRIERRIGDGGFAQVYRAFDTIEGVRVALKIPHPHLLDDDWIDSFRKEVRLTARLDHPNILPIKNASYIDGHFVVATPLAERSLADRLEKRLSVKAGLQMAEDMLRGLASAHRVGVLHCDIKPDNFLLFPENRVRLADFGIARVVLRTVSASGSGTLGYMAPEQAMGAPSLRSDVFSMGLVLYRMFSGELPAWPFRPPLPGIRSLREKLHADVVQLILRAIAVEPLRRFRDADRMLQVFLQAKPKALRKLTQKRRRRDKTAQRNDWSEVRWRQFRRLHGARLEARSACGSCGGPVSVSMMTCPWCSRSLARFSGPVREHRRCPRCRRGLKSDWRFCPWCYGAEVTGASTREYSDIRYEGSCSNRRCRRKSLFPFMRYCPWCRRKVKKRWSLPGVRERCSRCGWGVASEFWDVCPWCSANL